MTVLVGAVSENGQVVLASDSMQWGADGECSIGRRKTLRINDRCAMGFSGDATYAGRIAANLMGKPEWADEGGDVLKRIEEAGIQRDQWKTCGGVLAILRGILKMAAASVRVTDGKLPNIVFVGKDDDGVYLSEWFPPVEATPFWRTRNIGETIPGEAHVAAFGPGKIKGLMSPEAMIKKVKKPFTDRVLAICELYAERFPEQVNRDFWIREDCTSFVRRPLG